MKIAILLATYNSSAFLSEQLESLFSQSYKNFIIYVRDDGSSDDTLSILAKYCAKYDNIKVLDDEKKGRRAMGSFMWMLQKVEADYYMFCDHDDVWLPEKVEKSLLKIKEIESKDVPSVVCSDLVVVDRNLEVKSKSMWHYMKQRPHLLTKKRYAVTTNIFTGCTMMINNAAKDISLPISERALMHDAWIGLKVMANGGAIGCIDEPLILYRQHGNNVCGVESVGGINYLFNKFLKVKELISNWHKLYKMSKDAFNGRLTFIYFVFWKIIYLIIR